MRRILFILIICLTTALPLAAQDDDPPRTFYDTLDLSSPEATVITFVDAFEQDDFFTVYLVLHPDAQMQFAQEVRIMRLDTLFNTDRQDQVEPDVPVLAEGIGAMEHTTDGIFLFDDIMYSASQHNALLIDLRGGVEIVSSEETDDGVDVITSVGGIDGEVIFRMMLSNRGKWRVLQVIVPDGDEELMPWAVP